MICGKRPSPSPARSVGGYVLGLWRGLLTLAGECVWLTAFFRPAVFCGNLQGRHSGLLTSWGVFNHQVIVSCPIWEGVGCPKQKCPLSLRAYLVLFLGVVFCFSHPRHPCLQESGSVPPPALFSLLRIQELTGRTSIRGSLGCSEDHLTVHCPGPVVVVSCGSGGCPCLELPYPRVKPAAGGRVEK
jgi:hypothetical protein